jgi:hypothetical protein
MMMMMMIAVSVHAMNIYRGSRTLIVGVGQNRSVQQASQTGQLIPGKLNTAHTEEEVG